MIGRSRQGRDIMSGIANIKDNVAWKAQMGLGVWCLISTEYRETYQILLSTDVLFKVY